MTVTKKIESIEKLISDKKEERVHEHWATATTTPNGWCFELPLEDRVSLGYLFNDTITPAPKAISHFKELFKIILLLINLLGFHLVTHLFGKNKFHLKDEKIWRYCLGQWKHLVE